MVSSGFCGAAPVFVGVVTFKDWFAWCRGAVFCWVFFPNDSRRALLFSMNGL